MFLLHESETVVLLPTGAASAFWHSSHAGASNAPHKVLPKTKSDVDNVTQGQGVPDHQVLLTTSGAQCAQAFRQLFKGFTALAAPSGCFSHQGPAAGPRQCCVVVGHPTKALLWCPSSALWWVGNMSRPCYGAKAGCCGGCSPYQGLAVGRDSC